MKTPKVGDTVLVNTGHPSNGENFHPALVNCVHTEKLINTTVFPDAGETECVTSVEHASEFEPLNDPKEHMCWIWPDELEKYQDR